MQEKRLKKEDEKGEEIKQQRKILLFYVGQQNNTIKCTFFYKIKKWNWCISTLKFLFIFIRGEENKNGFDAGTWASYHGVNQNTTVLSTSS